MAPAALQETDLSKSYYPEIKNGSTNYGTDLESYIIGGGKTGIPPDLIPKPNYDDPKSRLAYAQNWTQKYGPLMQGRGDTPLRVNEIPEGGSDTSKNLSVKIGNKLGVDPALLYSSAMEEGMSGLYPDKNSQVDAAEDPKYPVDGYASFGLDNFSDAAAGLIKKGYLPKDFANNFKRSAHTNEKNEKVNSADFKTVDAALEAKAAMIKDAGDQVNGITQKANIQLSPKAKDFFNLVAYNAGIGNAEKMLKEYNRSGYLKDDKFLEKRPSDSWKVPYENTIRRIKMADALKQEQLF